MLRIKNPSPRKLQELLTKNSFDDSCILHYTGSMWGIGAKLSDKKSIQRIENAKNRKKQGMIVLIPDTSWFDRQEISVPDSVYSLMQQYFPGNLSIAFRFDDPAFEHIAVNGKVAFRVPTDPLLRYFIELLGEPIVSTSINYSDLPAENDLTKIEKFYESWFDVALIPHKNAFEEHGSASTLIEHLSGSETQNIEEIRCLREGSIPFYEVKKSFHKPQIMFVCTANICRSPIAEKLFDKMLNDDGLQMISDSSGLLEGGHMISMSSMQLLMEAGITKAQEHVSKQITPQMIAASWLVLTMEERHRDFLREANPNMANKILTLNEITGYDKDIDDPYGSELENYRKTYAIIEDRLKILLAKIKNREIRLKDK
jgi:protein-tyrosine phosphatase